MEQLKSSGANKTPTKMGAEHSNSADTNIPDRNAQGSNDIDFNPNDPKELTMFVQDLLEQMQSKFGMMSDSIISRIDDMGSRIDELERSIGGLMEQSGIDVPTSAGLSQSSDKSDSQKTASNRNGDAGS